MFSQSPVNAADPKIKKLRLKLDEARFFFPPDARAFCEHIEKQVFEALVASQASSRYPQDGPQRREILEQQTEADIALADIYSMLASKFERDLRFDQLAKGPEP